MKQIRFLLILVCWLPFAAGAEAEDAQSVSFGRSIARTVATLEYTFKLVVAPDESVVGVELALHNTSDSQPITLRGFVPPISIGVSKGKKSEASIGPRLVAAMTERRVREERYTLEPREKKELFIPIKVMNPDVVWARLDHYILTTRLLLHPEGAPRSGSHSPTPFEHFRDCTFTAKGMTINAFEAYASMKKKSK